MVGKRRESSYSAAHVSRQRIYALLLAVVLAAGCRRPPAEDNGALPENVPAPEKGSTSSGVAPGTSDLVLSAAVAHILKSGRRTGSVVEHCVCASGARMAEVHFVSADVTRQPMAQAFRQIAEQYPQIHWSSGDRVRVVDRSAAAGLLKVRVRHFLVVEDRPPQASLPALWQTPEVQSYMRRHRIRFARWRGPEAKMARTSPRVVQANNATVAEILDRMVEGYHPLYSAWAYRECRSKAGTMIEIALY